MEQLNLSIKAWAEDDRPREKLILKGKSALSNAELIAILLGSGTTQKSALDLAKEILNQSDNTLKNLGRKSVNEFKKINGIGVAKAVSLIAAIELGRRRNSEEEKKQVKMTSSKFAYNYLRTGLEDLYHEEFHVIFLNRANDVIQVDCLFVGGVSQTISDGKIIFKKALELNASALILAHNHPSGKLAPSEADLNLTKKLKKFAELIDIEILDHLIITNDSYFSFADEGLMHQ